MECSVVEHPQTSPCPATECGTFTPYATINPPYIPNGRSQGDILGEMAPTSRLGRQVNGVNYGYVQSWNIHRLHPDPPLLAPTSMTIHPIQGCESGRLQQAVGSLADHLRPGECSPISITRRPLLGKGTAEGSNSSHTKLFTATSKKYRQTIKSTTQDSNCGQPRGSCLRSTRPPTPDRLFACLAGSSAAAQRLRRVQAPSRIRHSVPFT